MPQCADVDLCGDNANLITIKHLFVFVSPSNYAFTSLLKYSVNLTFFYFEVVKANAQILSMVSTP